MKDKPVFSTAPKGSPASDENPTQPLSSGPLKMRLETKGRGGKAVTVLFNLPLLPSEARSLTKELQNAFGVGGTFKEGTIELRGDLRDKVEGFLNKKSLKVVRAGG